MNDIKVKPFLKWAGGKTSLIKEISFFYPFDDGIDVYIEPFLGGGAVLFDILNKYNLKKVYVSDINKELINVYNNLKYNVDELIDSLEFIENEYLLLSDEKRKEYYLKKRNEFNEIGISLKKSVLFIFLNKTCFNGLYRVNKKGEFNVPIGSYKKPVILDRENLINISYKLKNVDIQVSDYKNCMKYINERTFVYFDPPYRPLSSTSSFTSYTNQNFDDLAQKELARFVEKIDKKNAKFLLSNSDPKNIDVNDNFFDDLYKDFYIKRVYTSRAINSKGSLRGKISEILVTNIDKEFYE